MRGLPGTPPGSLQLAHHPLTEFGIKKFLADWEKVPKPPKR
jgi:hypothetical protein